MNGIVNVIKPSHMTSHDVVSFMRRTLGMKKIGHTGTLDPMAVGVLPICLGKGTKVVEFLMNDEKTYRCHMLLGASTDTQDQWGKILETSENIPDEDAIRDALLSFEGDILQVPPMYSALKVDGKKLVDLAREGIEVEREPRRQKLSNILIHNIDGAKIVFDVTCSKGTYVRTICHDLGLKLGCFGHMTRLVRLKSGVFRLEEAYTLEEIKRYVENKESDRLISGVDAPFIHYNMLTINDWAFQKVTNGVKIDLKGFLKTPTTFEQPFRVYFGNEFVGLASYDVSSDRLLLDKWLYCGDEA